MLRYLRSVMLFVAFFYRTATAFTPEAPVNVPVFCAVATGLLRGHIRDGKVLHNSQGAGRCRVWRARATSVLLVAISGRRRGRKRHGACGRRPQIDQKALPNVRALQKKNVFRLSTQEMRLNWTCPPDICRGCHFGGSFSSADPYSLSPLL